MGLEKTSSRIVGRQACDRDIAATNSVFARAAGYGFARNFDAVKGHGPADAISISAHLASRRRRNAFRVTSDYFLSVPSSGKSQCLSAISTTFSAATFSQLIFAALAFENFTMTARSTILFPRLSRSAMLPMT